MELGGHYLPGVYQLAQVRLAKCVLFCYMLFSVSKYNPTDYLILACSQSYLYECVITYLNIYLKYHVKLELQDLNRPLEEL